MMVGSYKFFDFFDFSFSDSVIDEYDLIEAIFLITNPSSKKNKGLKRVTTIETFQNFIFSDITDDSDIKSVCHMSL